MVTAKDGAPDPRIATATVSIVVLDVEDEVPIFKRAEYVATVPENMPDYFVTEVTVSNCVCTFYSLLNICFRRKIQIPLKKLPMLYIKDLLIYFELRKTLELFSPHEVWIMRKKTNMC